MSSTDFFRLVFDSKLEDYTYFDEPTDTNGNIVDWWNFTGCGFWKQEEALMVTANPVGRIYDICMGPGDVPYVTKKVVDAFESDRRFTDAVQFVPLNFHHSIVYIMNILPVIACVDEQNTGSIMRWQEGDGEPEKVGQFRQIVDLRVNSKKLRGVDICRVKDWEVCIIVSEKTKNLIEDNKLGGVAFWPS
jgi:hypothetical protein